LTINGFERIIWLYTEETGLEMDYTFDSDIVSDLYKEAYGRRPSDIFWSQWLDASDAEKQAIWDGLIATEVITSNKEREHQIAAVAGFERHVQNTILMGARDRETALRWIMQSSIANGDWEFLCYLEGLPYGYFKTPVSA
jgi:hypothetical protein